MYNGLLTSEAFRLLEKNGRNEIPEKPTLFYVKILKNLFSPIALMLLFASGLSFLLKKDFDGYFILVLLVVNIVITLWQENKADNAIQKLNRHLEQKVKVLRDGHWQLISSRLIVAGDIIRLAIGDVISADGQIVEADHVSVNESALTGESLPKDKLVNDKVFSGSFMATGIATVKITATGVNTSFGKTLFSVEKVMKKSLLEKDIIGISKFLTFLSLIAVAILTIVFLIERASFLELLTLDLSLIIAGIPISLPTVLTLIIEFGVINLSKKDVIVRRLSALEDLANVNFLLTDKTGTLTKNKIVVHDIYTYNEYTRNSVLEYASILAAAESDNPIDDAIKEKMKALHIILPATKKINFIPADSERKRSTIIVNNKDHQETITVGAPQIVKQYCVLDKDTSKKFETEIEALALNGYRTLAVAVGSGDKEIKMKMVGLLALSDTLRDDAKSVIGFLEDNGIGVAMVTGDNRAIAAQIMTQLSLHSQRIITKDKLDRTKWEKVGEDFFTKTGAFAEILPEDKFKLVQKAKNFFVIASNGDGVNDLPAIKAANVGIAVKSAVAALKATADIVLLSEGISVIKDAIIESRKIFERIYTYSLYRISESLRLIITIAVLGIFYKAYPMTALQIILIALLNDIPIISLAFDRVNITKSPSKIEVKKRFILSSLYGSVGVVNSLILFFIVKNILHLDWAVIQTIYFLKLTVSGHMLIYVAHTKQRWYKFLPSREVIWATTITQLLATGLAFSGFLMPGHLSILQVLLVWIWALFWMQIGELMKIWQEKFN